MALLCRRGLPKEGAPGRLARGLPEFQDFIDYRSAISDGDPHQDCLDWQPRPCSYEQAHHLFLLITPPAIGHSQRYFPKHADEENHEDCQTESAPVDGPVHRSE